MCLNKLLARVFSCHKKREEHSCRKFPFNLNLCFISRRMLHKIRTRKPENPKKRKPLKLMENLSKTSLNICLLHFSFRKRNETVYEKVINFPSIHVLNTNFHFKSNQKMQLYRFFALLNLHTFANCYNLLPRFPFEI